MNPSQACYDLIKISESLKLAAYPDPASGGDPWTIGYGHTGGVKRGDACTLAQANAWLASDVAATARQVADVIEVPVTQNQFDALVSFTYNEGIERLRGSTLLRLLNLSQYAAAAKQFPFWNLSCGQEMPGLIRRRAAEQALFES